MSEILNSSRTNHVRDTKLIKNPEPGPPAPNSRTFFRITAKSLETQNELGKAERLIRVWLRGRILHLESIRLKRETLGMEKSIFGMGLFIGVVAVTYGYDCGCRAAELLANQ